MTEVQPNITVLCGRVQDLLTQLEAIVPQVMVHHDKYDNTIYWDRDDYEIEMISLGDQILIKYVYMGGDDAIVVAVGNWGNNRLDVLFLPPTYYSDLLASSE